MTFQIPLRFFYRFTKLRNTLLIIAIVGTLTSDSRTSESDPRTQPDQLSIGQVRVGARVEASILVRGQDADNAVDDINVKLPSFLTLKNVSRDPQRNWCIFSLTFETRKSGKREDRIEIYSGTVKSEVPVAIEVLSQDEDLTRVLVVETPFHGFATKNGALFQTWVDLVRRARLDVNYLECSREDEHGPVEVLEGVELFDFDVVLLATSGLCHAQQADWYKLAHFVEEGGRIIIAANRFLVPSVPKANQFLEYYGLKMLDEEPRCSREWILNSTHLTPHSFTKLITRLRFFRPSPISVRDERYARIIVSAPPYPECGFVTVTKAGKGEVIALGQSLWYSWIGAEEAKEFDNSLLLQQLITEPCK